MLRGVTIVQHTARGCVALPACFSIWKDSGLVEQVLTHDGSALTVSIFAFLNAQEKLYQVSLFPLRGCNKVQEERGAVCEQVTTINQEIQKIKSGIQQLKDVAKKEKLKSQEIFVNLKSALEKYHERIEKTTEECCTRIEEKTAELKRRMFRGCSAQAALQ